MAKKKRKRTPANKAGKDALDWQERHSPTVQIAVNDTEGQRRARRNLTRCRQSEAWRHTRLSGIQREAQTEMERAYMLRTRGAGAAVSRYGVPAGGSSRADVGSRADETWRAWAAEAPRRRIMVAAVIDCLAEPRTLAEIEQAHRMRKGQAFANYAAGLDLWCELRGWIRAAPIGAMRLMPERVA